MIKVKICGLRRAEDVAYVNAHLPDYVGFIFAPSKRRVTMEEAVKLSEMLQERIKTVGVFVNESLEKVLTTSEACNLHVLQLHGDEPPAYVKALKKAAPGKTVWKAVRVKEPGSIEVLGQYEADAYLLDAYVEGTYGGAGVAFDWNLAAAAQKYGNIILAGGLNLQNVREAIGIVKPFGVDISSGVETDGWKDESKIKDFIYSVRRNVY